MFVNPDTILYITISYLNHTQTVFTQKNYENSYTLKQLLPYIPKQNVTVRPILLFLFWTEPFGFHIKR